MVVRQQKPFEGISTNNLVELPDPCQIDDDRLFRLVPRLLPSQIKRAASQSRTILLSLAMKCTRVPGAPV